MFWGFPFLNLGKVQQLVPLPPHGSLPYLRGAGKGVWNGTRTEANRQVDVINFIGNIIYSLSFIYQKGHKTLDEIT